MSAGHTAALGKGPGLGASSPVASSARLVRSAACQPRDDNAPTELLAHGSKPAHCSVAWEWLHQAAGGYSSTLLSAHSPRSR